MAIETVFQSSKINECVVEGVSCAKTVEGFDVLALGKEKWILLKLVRMHCPSLS